MVRSVKSSVYWIHRPEHTDMFTQGYIGVSQDVSARFEQHRKKTQNPHLTRSIQKYGWDNLIKQILLVGKKQYCLDIEKKLRSFKNTGWNLVIGGGQPPVAYGNKTRLGMSSWNKGLKTSQEVIEKLRKSHLGQVAWNKGLKNVQVAWNKGTEGLMGNPHRRVYTEEDKLHYKVECICPVCGTKGKMAGMTIWHFNHCKGQRNFVARVTVNRKRFGIGTFETKEQADNARIEYYKGVANGLND